MEVILLEKVANLGKMGEKVNVRAGYGRNYLIPGGKAIFATAENIAAFEQRRAQLEKSAQDKKDAADARAARLAALGKLTIGANAGDEGKLFGSVGTRDIADAVSAAGVEISKNEVRMPDGPLRELGDYEVEIQLHADVVATVTIAVVAE